MELYWTNESSIIDSQSYSREKDDSGETTISTTLRITFDQPILLSCRSQYFNRKRGYISSWVQLERNEGMLRIVFCVTCICVLHISREQTGMIHVKVSHNFVNIICSLTYIGTPIKTKPTIREKLNM